MKNIILSLVAIGIAGVAAIAATTAMLNTPVRPAYIGVPKSDKPAEPSSTQPTLPPATPPSGPAPDSSGGKPATPAPDGKAGEPGGAKTPDGTKPEEEGDKDPYEGIAPEDLPPDLQYDADSSVSFPTNI